MSKVALVRCENYDYTEVKNALKRSFDLLGGIEKFIKSGKIVLIKPNIVNAFAENIVITHPLVIKCMIEICKENGAVVWVGENSAGDFAGTTLKAFETSGIKKICEEEGTEIKIFQGGKFITKEHNVLGKVKIAKAVLDADVIINLPKLKTAEVSFITGAVKNLFGMVSHETRKYIHSNFSTNIEFGRALAELYSVIKPHLNVMDAVEGMEGYGPTRGTPRKVGLILASEDGVALDAIASEIIGYDVMKVHSVRFANNIGIGLGDISKIKIVGENLKNSKILDFVPSPSYENEAKVLYIPEFTPECIKCGKCVKSCPVGAISKKFVINKERCISCFACQEVCDISAMGTRSLAKNSIVKINGEEYYVGDKLYKIKNRINLFVLKMNNLKLKLTRKEDFMLLDLIFAEKDLSENTGVQISEFIKKLGRNKVKVLLRRALPLCITKNNPSLIAKHIEMNEEERNEKNALQKCNNCVYYHRKQCLGWRNP